MKTFEELLERFRRIELPECDLIVAIANGGIIPAAILNQRLGKELRLVYINLRDASQHPRYPSPRVLHPLDFDVRGKRVLLVDDRVKTGATFVAAKQLLVEAAAINTFAVNGQADYSLYDEACFPFPWNI